MADALMAANDLPPGGPHPCRVYNPRAARLSAAYDGAGDRRWFQANPDRTDRFRPVTDLECSAFGLPEGAWAVVVPVGGQLHYVYAVRLPPAEGREAGRYDGA